jgi:hypothetical protein
MDKPIQKLVSISSNALSGGSITADAFAGSPAPLYKELKQMLELKNGFYAFESALHIFPSQSPDKMDLEKWNDLNLWRKDYGDMTEGMFFFAEDIFGGQFCIYENKIYAFDPETAEIELLAENLQGWASAILEDYDYLTGYPLAHEWQKRSGAIPPGKRLAPKIPFIAGGEYVIDNLYIADPIELMKFRGNIAKQIKDLPDGTEINFKVVE